MSTTIPPSNPPTTDATRWHAKREAVLQKAIDAAGGLTTGCKATDPLEDAAHAVSRAIAKFNMIYSRDELLTRPVEPKRPVYGKVNVRMRQISAREAGLAEGMPCPRDPNHEGPCA